MPTLEMEQAAPRRPVQACRASGNVQWRGFAFIGTT